MDDDHCVVAIAELEALRNGGGGGVIHAEMEIKLEGKIEQVSGLSRDWQAEGGHSRALPSRDEARVACIMPVVAKLHAHPAACLNRAA